MTPSTAEVHTTSSTGDADAEVCFGRIAEPRRVDSQDWAACIGQDNNFVTIISIRFYYHSSGTSGIFARRIEILGRTGVRQRLAWIRYYLGTANAGGADTFRLCWAAAPIVRPPIRAQCSETPLDGNSGLEAIRSIHGGPNAYDILRPPIRKLFL